MTSIFSTLSRHEFLDELKERYGPQLQHLTQTQKRIFRAALASYVALKPIWKANENSISCIDCCIEGAGVDYDIWDEDPELVEYMQACDKLTDRDIEGLIEALTAQLKQGI